jgi:hypothetical protein
MTDFPPVTERVLPEGTWTHPGSGMTFRGDIPLSEAAELRAQGKIAACPQCESKGMAYTDPSARERRMRVLHQETCPVYRAAEDLAEELLK